MNESERSERINQLLETEISIRNTIVQDSKERIGKFLQEVDTDICFDPVYIDYFADSQKRIDLLTERLNRLSNGENPTPEEIEEVERRVDAANNFFSGVNESLATHIESIEDQTQAIYKKISIQIREYENELLKNRELKRKIDERMQQIHQT